MPSESWCLRIGVSLLNDLVNILKANFSGNETLRVELANRLPRYGNGIAEVDGMTQLAADAFADAVRSHKNSRGGAYVPGYYSMTCHYGFGRYTGALPNGRPAGVTALQRTCPC